MFNKIKDQNYKADEQRQFLLLVLQQHVNRASLYDAPYKMGISKGQIPRRAMAGQVPSSVGSRCNGGTTKWQVVSQYRLQSGQRKAQSEPMLLSVLSTYLPVENKACWAFCQKYFNPLHNIDYTKRAPQTLETHIYYCNMAFKLCAITKQLDFIYWLLSVISVDVFSYAMGAINK